MTRPRKLNSCVSCLAWGAGFRRGLCAACADFSAQPARPIAPCVSCGRVVSLRKRHCRLCWAQARFQCPDRPQREFASPANSVHDHQLFLSDIGGRRAAVPRTRVPSARGQGTPGSLPPPPPARPHSRFTQLLLFHDPVARTYSYGQTNRSIAPAPDNEWLAWGLHLAHLMGETRGWNPAVRGNTERALIVLLSEHADGI